MNTIQISNVLIRQSDNLFNLNDLHKAAGGEPKYKISNWLQLQQTNELIDEIFKAGIPALKKEQVIKVNHGGKNRGTFVCKELVYAYATWISAKFFLQVIRTFDAILSGSLKTPPTPSTIEERKPLRKAISHLVVKHGLNFSDAYRLIHQRFNIENITQLPRENLNDAIHYVHSLTVSKTLYGEVLDRLALPEPKKGVYLDEEEYHYLQTLTRHAPYLIAYFERTAPAVSELNRDITYKMGVHIHNSIVATYGLEKFNRIPITWQDAYRDFF